MHHRHDDSPTTAAPKDYSDDPDHEVATNGEHRGSVIHDPDQHDDPEARRRAQEEYAAQLTGIFILEFGVIFHSIFIGLTLAVSGDEFIVLYIVLVFHQSFEGLALGSRLASIAWPPTKRWTPYLLGAGYALSTPIAIAIGLGVRETFAPGSRNFLVVNGVFDSLSAGILIYTGLVELMVSLTRAASDLSRVLTGLAGARLHLQLADEAGVVHGDHVCVRRHVSGRRPDGVVGILGMSERAAPAQGGNTLGAMSAARMLRFAV